MADDKKPAPPATPRPAAGLEPIRVRTLQSKGPDTALPRPARSNIIHAGPRQTGETVTIQYEPWQRHHRVREVADDGKVTEVCIPESWVAYTPDLD